MAARDHLTRISGDRLANSLTPHTDAAEIGLAEFKKKLAHRTILPGQDGAAARLQIEIISAGQRAIGRELDAGLPESTVAALLVDTLAALICSHAMKFVYDEPPEARVALVDMMTRTLAGKARTLAATVDDLPANQVAGVVARRFADPGHS